MASQEIYTIKVLPPKHGSVRSVNLHWVKRVDQTEPDSLLTFADKGLALLWQEHLNDAVQFGVSLAERK